MRFFLRNLSQIAAKPQEVQLIKRFNQNDLDKFSELTGDNNIMHSNNTPIENRLVHGALLNGIVAGIMGSQLPGPGTVVLEQQFKFPKPCYIEVNTVFKVRLISSRKITLAEYEAIQGNDIVFQGTAKLLKKQI